MLVATLHEVTCPNEAIGAGLSIVNGEQRSQPVAIGLCHDETCVACFLDPVFSGLKTSGVLADDCGRLRFR